MKTFDFYEFTGVLTPGALVLYFVGRICPETAPFIEAKNFTLGDLGLFVILAYVAGHLVQALGNVVERLYWKPFGGVPTDWVLKETQSLLAQQQVEALPDKLKEITGITLGKRLVDITNRNWFPITQQVYAAVSAAGRAQRVDTFNGNYGMFRGIASAFILCAVFSMILHWPDGWPVSLALLSAGVLSLVRMHRFGTHFARELFVQFLQLNPERNPHL